MSSEKFVWDHRLLDNAISVNFLANRSVSLFIKDSLIAQACRKLGSSKDEVQNYFLVGSFAFEPAVENIKINVHKIESKIASELNAPMDILISCQVQNNKNQLFPKDWYSSSVKILHDAYSKAGPIKLENLLQARVACLNQRYQCQIEVEMLLPGTSFYLVPVSPLPVKSSIFSEGFSHDPKLGFLWFDESSNEIILAQECDSKLTELPLIGIWISGISTIYHPLLWASAQRYVYGGYKKRLCIPPEPFLAAAFGQTLSCSSFYECYLDCSMKQPQFFLMTGTGTISGTQMTTGMVFPNKITIVEMKTVESDDCVENAVCQLRESIEMTTMPKIPVNSPLVHVPDDVPPKMPNQHPQEVVNIISVVPDASIISTGSRSASSLFAPEGPFSQFESSISCIGTLVQKPFNTIRVVKEVNSSPIMINSTLPRTVFHSSPVNPSCQSRDLFLPSHHWSPSKNSPLSIEVLTSTVPLGSPVYKTPKVSSIQTSSDDNVTTQCELTGSSPRIDFMTSFPAIAPQRPSLITEHPKLPDFISSAGRPQHAEMRDNHGLRATRSPPNLPFQSCSKGDMLQDHAYNLKLLQNEVRHIQEKYKGGLEILCSQCGTCGPNDNQERSGCNEVQKCSVATMTSLIKTGSSKNVSPPCEADDCTCFKHCFASKNVIQSDTSRASKERSPPRCFTECQCHAPEIPVSCVKCAPMEHSKSRDVHCRSDCNDEFFPRFSECQSHIPKVPFSCGNNAQMKSSKINTAPFSGPNNGCSISEFDTSLALGDATVATTCTSSTVSSAINFDTSEYEEFLLRGIQGSSIREAVKLDSQIFEDASLSKGMPLERNDDNFKSMQKFFCSNGCIPKVSPALQTIPEDNVASGYSHQQNTVASETLPERGGPMTFANESIFDSRLLPHIDHESQIFQKSTTEATVMFNALSDKYLSKDGDLTRFESVSKANSRSSCNSPSRTFPVFGEATRTTKLTRPSDMTLYCLKPNDLSFSTKSYLERHKLLFTRNSSE